jgi:hypothetical protein
VKRAYDHFFVNVDPDKDCQPNRTFYETRSLVENQHLSKPFQTFQTKPSESNTISNVAASVSTSGTAAVIHSVDDDEDSEATPPPKFISLVKQNITNLELSPEADETQPPEADQNKPASETLKSP